jgi:hypothetical protein
MEKPQQLPDDFLSLCRSITAKRPRTVIDHILQYGFVTTEDLKEIYGYNHPPRAARDVREHGVPLETFSAVGRDGRKIAAYRFGDLSKARFSKLSGRTGLSKKIKDDLIKQYGRKCFIYLEEVDERDLQVDHRIPFEISGEPSLQIDKFMLLCGSANRSKSWSCENCNNWKTIKDQEICKLCYWAYPENYMHIAMRPVRRVDLLWEGDDIQEYERLQQESIDLGRSIPDFVKELIRNQLATSPINNDD